MILITGGAYQGKLDYALYITGLSPTHAADGEKADFDTVFEKAILNKLHFLVKRLIEKGVDPIDFLKAGVAKNPSVILIADDISSGLIPLNKEDRLWREAAGRALCFAASKAEKVIRMQCGLPLYIKGEES